VITNRVVEEQRTAKLIGSGLITGIKGEDGPQQLETARAEIDAVEKNLLTAKDDERLFYISRLKVWADRLDVINRQPVHKASHQEAATLISQLNQRVAQLTS
jgi:hypothetical protein